MYNGRFCGNENSISALNVRNWKRIRDDINRVSRDDKSCMTNYDLQGSGRLTDFKVQCSNEGITIRFYSPNSTCSER